jgi:DNA transformation protein and related proteins
VQYLLSFIGNSGYAQTTHMLFSAHTPVGDLRNLGPSSSAWLNEVGIFTKGQLEEIGPAEAYLRVCEAGLNPTINFLWALAGAIFDVDWTEIPKDMKDRLKEEMKEDSRVC